MICPVLILVGIGAILQKKLTLDITTLSRITIWVLVPTFLFVKVYDSQVSWPVIGGVVGVLLVPMAVLGVIVFLVCRRARAKGTTLATVTMSCVVINAGNFGIPVAELIYDPKGVGLWFEGMTDASDGVTIQALAVMMSNMALWCIGYSVMSFMNGGGIKGVFGYFKLPMIYAIVGGFVLRDYSIAIPAAVDYPIRLAAQATVPIMLITLGAQLAQNARWPRWKIVGPVMLVKLLALPALTALVAYWCGMWPWPGAQLVIAASAPAAVNVLILTLEMEGDADMAADCVFWTTIASAVTVTAVLALVSQAAVG